MTRKWPLIGVALAVLWLFVRGVALEPSRILGEFLIGLVVGMPVALVFRRMYADDVSVSRAARATPYALLYFGVFAKELLTANVDVAYRTLAPDPGLEPDVVVVPLRVRSDAAITTLANSITLTPGTLTMDYDEETNALYVHGITGRNREDVVDPIRTWEEYALVIFDEEGKPGDPIPELPVGGERTGSRSTSERRPDGGERQPYRGADRSDGGEQHGN